MTENPMIKVIERLTRMAKMHGTAFCRVTWDEEADTFHFGFLLKEHVTVYYDEKKHD